MKTLAQTDAERARPYATQPLRKIFCAPLERLTDDYLREHDWKVEAIFPPVHFIKVDQRPAENALIVVLKKEPSHENPYP